MNPLPTNLTAADAISVLGLLKTAEKKLKARTDEVLEILNELLAAGELEELSYEPGVYEADGVRLTRSTRTTWQYSPAIKSLQQVEQENGMATAKTSEFWTTKLL